MLRQSPEIHYFTNPMAQGSGQYLSSGGSEELFHTSRMVRLRVYWSPDNQRIASITPFNFSRDNRQKPAFLLVSGTHHLIPVFITHREL